MPAFQQGAKNDCLTTHLSESFTNLISINTTIITFQQKDFGASVISMKLESDTMPNSERAPLFTTHLQNKEIKRLQANKLNIFPISQFWRSWNK